MAILGLVEKLRASLAKQRTESDAYADYRELLQRVIDPMEDIDPSEALSICESMGRQLEDLEKDAERLRQRQLWARQMVEGKQAQADIVGVVAEIEQAEAEFRRVQQSHQAKMRLLIEQRQSLDHLIGVAGAAENSMRQSIIDPDHLREMESLRRENVAVAREEGEVKERLRSLTTAIDNAKQELARWEREPRSRMEDPVQEFNKRQFERAKSSLNARQSEQAIWEGKLVPLRQRRVAAERRLAELDQKALLP